MTDEQTHDNSPAAAADAAPTQGPASPGHALPRLGPNHWDLYILVAAVALGLLLSPWVLGRLSDARYQRLFVGGVEENAKLEDFIAQTKSDVERLIATVVTEAAIDEYIASRRSEKEQLEQAMTDARGERTACLRRVLLFTLAALLALMIIETLFDDRVAARTIALRRILARLRYIAISVAIVLTLARIDLLWPK